MCVLPLIKRHARQGVSQGVAGAFDAVQLHTTILQEEAPAENTLGLEALECVVFVIRADMDMRATMEHGPELFKCLHNGEKLLFTNSAVALRRVELAAVAGHGGTFLHDGSTELSVRGVHADVEWLVMIRTPEKGILGKESLHLVEGLLLFTAPRHAASKTGEFGQGSKDVRPARTHVAAEVDGTKEGAQLSNSLGRLQGKNGRNLLLPGLQTSGDAQSRRNQSSRRRLNKH